MSDPTTLMLAANASAYIQKIEETGISQLPINIQRDEWRSRAAWGHATASYYREMLVAFGVLDPDPAIDVATL